MGVKISHENVRLGKLANEVFFQGDDWGYINGTDSHCYTTGRCNSVVSVLMINGILTKKVFVWGFQMSLLNTQQLWVMFV